MTSPRRNSYRPPTSRCRSVAWRVIAVVLVAVIAAAVATVVVGRSTSASSGGATPSRSAPWARASGDAADGVIPDGADLQPDAAEVPAIGRLDPALRAALTKAFAAARDDGVDLYVNSGWRSTTLQNRLLDEADEKYGSREAALKWVSLPEISHHVSGKAVDIGPFAGVDWLDAHSSEFGLCRLYSNEWWHYELATTPGGTCPAQLPNAAAAGA